MKESMNEDASTKLTYKLMPELTCLSRYIKQDLRVAVIGFGKMGILHSAILNLLRPGLVKAIVDKSRLVVLGASRLIKDIKFYRDLDKMIDFIEPDAVYVTTPTRSHYVVTSRLLEAGINYIFVEKPPTVNTEHLNALFDKMANKQIVMVGLQKRYAFPFRHAKILLSEDVIGDVEKVYAYIKSGDITVSTDRFIHLGRGVLLDLGIHLVDLLEWLLGIESVEKAKYRSMYSGVDDYLEARLRTDNGATADIEVTWSDPAYRLPEVFIEIHGTKGVLRISEDYLKAETTEEHPLLDNTKLVMYKPHYYQGIPPVNLADPEFTLENIHFLSCIYESAEPLTSLKNVKRTMELIDKLYAEAGIQHG
jgi:predicted dehydrogenase